MYIFLLLLLSSTVLCQTSVNIQDPENSISVKKLSDTIENKINNLDAAVDVILDIPIIRREERSAKKSKEHYYKKHKGKKGSREKYWRSWEKKYWRSKERRRGYGGRRHSKERPHYYPRYDPRYDPRYNPKHNPRYDPRYYPRFGSSEEYYPRNPCFFIFNCGQRPRSTTTFRPITTQKSTTITSTIPSTTSSSPSTTSTTSTITTTTTFAPTTATEPVPTTEQPTQQRPEFVTPSRKIPATQGPQEPDRRALTTPKTTTTTTIPPLNPRFTLNCKNAMCFREQL